MKGWKKWIVNYKTQRMQMNQTVVVESIDEVLLPQEEVVENITQEIEETTEIETEEIKEDTEE